MPIEPNELVVASTNTGKAAEIQLLLEGLDNWVVHPLTEGLQVPDETGNTFLENAVQKAEYYSGRLKPQTRVVADDSGLIVDALDGRPGLWSSRYAPTDESRNDKLLAELEGVPFEQRTARFVCALALARNGRAVWQGEGHVDGVITTERMGTNGFGYDPLFWVPEYGQTTGQMEPALKNRISHRGIALAKLRAWLEHV